MMEIQIAFIASCVVLTIIAGIFVLRPLFEKPVDSLDVEWMAETEMDRLMNRKNTIYGNLKDLTLEYRMGRLSDEDFRQLEAGYKTEAAVILQKLEQMGVTDKLDESIEKEIASRRSRISTDAAVLPGHKTLCPFCGAEIIPRKNFCADCGHRLSAVSSQQSAVDRSDGDEKS